MQLPSPVLPLLSASLLASLAIHAQAHSAQQPEFKVEIQSGGDHEPPFSEPELMWHALKRMLESFTEKASQLRQAKPTAGVTDTT